MADERGLERLIELYKNERERQFALFLGAGVNGGPWAAEHPVCASWPKLLEVLSEDFQRRELLEATLEAECANWIRVATTLLQGLDRTAVIQAIDEAIYADVFTNPASRQLKPKKHKVIEWRVLQKMPTLCAAVCFSASIRDPTKSRSMCRNPKISRVLTTNYDFFFGAAWPRYTSMRRSWWTETWASAGTRLESAGPVVYLHGYLPYSAAGDKDLVITGNDYAKAYDGLGGSSPGFAWQKLNEAIEQCHLIFLGFSFSDDRVAEGLRESNKQHFAFLHQDEVPAIEAAEAVGVIPITLKSWTQLSGTLGKIYAAGLTSRELKRTTLSASQYWDALQKGLQPRSSPGASS